MTKTPNINPPFFAEGVMPDGSFSPEGNFAPFRVFSTVTQDHLPGEYLHRSAAEKLARTLCDAWPHRRRSRPFGGTVWLARGAVTCPDVAAAWGVALGADEWRILDDPENPGYSADFASKADALRWASDCGLHVIDLTGKAPAKARDLNDWLEAVQVISPHMWENETGPVGWFAVSNDDGIIAYFGQEVDAFRFRLDYINRKMNP